jgi:Glycoside-hydrolase family GH114
MIRQECSGKGFDGVDPDIDDSDTDNTGFVLTETEDINYDKLLASYAHSLGLAWGQKNGDNDPRFSAALEPFDDFLFDEECNYYHTCQTVAEPYLWTGKLVLYVEYTNDWGNSVGADLRRFYPEDGSTRIDRALFTATLTGQRDPCQ